MKATQMYPKVFEEGLLGSTYMKTGKVFTTAAAAALSCGDLGINSKTPNRILTRRLPDTKCINASPRIRLHASIWLKSDKRKIIKSKVANGKRSRQN